MGITTAPLQHKADGRLQGPATHTHPFISTKDSMHHITSLVASAAAAAATSSSPPPPLQA